MSIKTNKLFFFILMMALWAIFKLNFVIFRETRIASGEGISLFSVHVPLFLSLLSLWMLIFFLSQIKRNNVIEMAMIGVINFIFVILLITLIFSVHKVYDADYPFARITPGGGFWLMIFLVFTTLSTYKPNRNNRFYWLTVCLWYSGLLVFILLLVTGSFNELSLLKEYQNKQDRFIQEVFQHLFITFTAVISALILGIPLGIIAFRKKWITTPVFTFLNFVQTIPSIALFGLLLVPLAYLANRFPVLRQMGIAGIGNAPALLAITLYSLLPIVLNTYTSLVQINQEVIEAGKGMGMNSLQQFWGIQLPLALPIILTGIRIATIQALGNTTVVALIGAGGLGTFIFQGLGQAASDLILLGAIPIILLSVLTDLFLKILIAGLTPAGLKRDKG
ncbi:MAG: ABC transporter permease subunit [Spirochaetes bacterium]|nr:ABC transporter permease subunit [Spirochaetota bacterium]